MTKVLTTEEYLAIGKPMTINDYKAGDKVEVLMNNPRNDNKDEWRSAEVIDKRTIYPNQSVIY